MVEKKVRRKKSNGTGDPSSVLQVSEEMGQAPSSNGHREFPSGNAGLYGVDDMDKGFGANTPPSRDFMTAHTADMGRLLAEAVLTEDDIYNLKMQEYANQRRLGFVDLTMIWALGAAASIGKNGRGREDGVKVETLGARNFLARAKSGMGKLFGMGAGQPEGETRQNTISQGY